MNDQRPADLAAIVIACALIAIVASVFADWMGYLEEYRR